MDDIINPDKHSAEVAALNHEIYELTKKLEEKDALLKEKTTQALLMISDDPEKPFDNPTEYSGFGGEYSQIQPRLGTLGYNLPLDPDYVERKGLRKFYSIGGWCIIFQFLLSFGASMLLSTLILLILQILNPEVSQNILYNYMYGSSVLIALNMVIYLICNVANTFLGIKWAKIKARSLIETRDFHFSQAIQYCAIALFIWVVSIYSSTLFEMIFSKFGLTTVVDQSGLGTTPLAVVLSAIYACVIAPITEEMLFRGMLLRVFSKANQRFAIFATAFFFGLAHGNIPQFILAFLLGMFLAHITLKHSSIIPAVIVHIFVNTFSTVYGQLADKGTIIVGAATMLLFAAAIFGVVMLLVFRGNDKFPASTPKQSRRGISVAVCSIPFCTAAVIQIGYMLYTLIKRS